MANLAWLEEVRNRLTESHLPPAYIRRVVEEIADHLEDLKEENMGTDASSRLGDPNEVAEAAITSFRRRSFLARHPTAAFLVFAILPLVMLPLSMHLICVAGVLIFCRAYEWFGYVPSSICLDRDATVKLTYLPSLLAIIIPSLLASIFYCKLAKRLGIGRKWMLLSCMVVAVLALACQCSFFFSNGLGENNGFCLAVGFRFAYGNLDKMLAGLPWQLLQFLVPVVVALWFVRHGRNHDQVQLAS
jgi:hypothetical protein